MRFNPSSWDGYELALEGEELLHSFYRSNPEPDFAEELDPKTAKELDKKERGSIVKKMDKGILPDVEAAKTGDVDAAARVRKHYYKFLVQTLGGLFVRGSLWPKQKTFGKWSEEDFRNVAEMTFDVLFTGTHVTDEERQRKREHRPVILKWQPERSSFTTFLLGVAKRIAREYFKVKIRRFKGEREIREETEVEQLDPETRALGEQQSRVLAAALPKLSEKHRRVMEARLGRDRDQSEKAELKGQGKPYTRSYQEMKAYLGLDSIGTVMTHLFRARKELEKIAGLPLRGLVGVAKEQFGKDERGSKGKGKGGPALEPAMAPTKEQLAELEAALAPKKTVVRRRQNPAEVWIYFETEDDLIDLLEAGYLDEDTFDQCRQALYAMGW